MPSDNSRGANPQDPTVLKVADEVDPPSLNCPDCGLRLRHLRSEAHTHYFACDHHGVMLLTLGGDLRRGEPE